MSNSGSHPDHLEVKGIGDRTPTFIPNKALTEHEVKTAKLHASPERQHSSEEGLVKYGDQAAVDE